MYILQLLHFTAVRIDSLERLILFYIFPLKIHSLE